MALNKRDNRSKVPVKGSCCEKQQTLTGSTTSTGSGLNKKTEAEGEVRPFLGASVVSQSSHLWIPVAVVMVTVSGQG